MKTLTRTAAFSIAFASIQPGSLPAQSLIPLVQNTNPQEITTGQNPYVSQILPGQTLYVGIPYTGGSWPTTEPADFARVSTYLLGDGAAGSAGFNFYSATDSGTALSGITPMAAFTPSTVPVNATASSDPADPANYNNAFVSADLDIPTAPTGDLYAAAVSGVVWLGITNFGASTLLYYTGSPFGGGVPTPTYAFTGPFTSGASSLNPDTYTYNADTTLAAGNQNIHPYFNVSIMTVPEPAGSLMLGLAGFLWILQRRRSASL